MKSRLLRAHDLADADRDRMFALMGRSFDGITRRQFDREGVDDFSGNLILQGKHITEVAVISLRP